MKRHSRRRRSGTAAAAGSRSSERLAQHSTSDSLLRIPRRSGSLRFGFIRRAALRGSQATSTVCRRSCDSGLSRSASRQIRSRDHSSFSGCAERSRSLRRFLSKNAQILPPILREQKNLSFIRLYESEKLNSLQCKINKTISVIF